MKRRLLSLVLLPTFFLIGCHAGQVKVPRTDAPDSPMIWRDKIDGTIFVKKTRAIRLSLDTSVLGIRTGPAVEFRKSVEQKWNERVNTVNVMYQALCNDWNSGLLSIARFNRKRDEIDELYNLLAREESGFKDDVGEYWQKQSAPMFAELNQELKAEKERELKANEAELEKAVDAAIEKFDAQRSRIGG